MKTQKYSQRSIFLTMQLFACCLCKREVLKYIMWCVILHMDILVFVHENFTIGAVIGSAKIYVFENL